MCHDVGLGVHRVFAAAAPTGVFVWSMSFSPADLSMISDPAVPEPDGESSQGPGMVLVEGYMYLPQPMPSEMVRVRGRDRHQQRMPLPEGRCCGGVCEEIIQK